MTGLVRLHQSVATRELFDLACKAQLRRLSHLEGLVMAAAIETSTGTALHSVRLPTEIDLPAMCKTMADLLRGQAAARVDPEDDAHAVVLHTRFHAHFVRPLRREPLVALYLIVEAGGGRGVRARDAIAEATFVLDSFPGIA